MFAMVWTFPRCLPAGVGGARGNEARGAPQGLPAQGIARLRAAGSSEPSERRASAERSNSGAETAVIARVRGVEWTKNQK
jgi:hypothetical protein